MYVLIHTFLSLDKIGLLTQNLTVFNMYIALVKERMCVLSLVCFPPLFKRPTKIFKHY